MNPQNILFYSPNRKPNAVGKPRLGPNSSDNLLPKMHNKEREVNNSLGGAELSHEGTGQLSQYVHVWSAQREEKEAQKESHN